MAAGRVATLGHNANPEALWNQRYEYVRAFIGANEYKNGAFYQYVLRCSQSAYMPR